MKIDKQTKIYGIYITYTKQEFVETFPLRRYRIWLRFLSFIGGKLFTLKIK